MGQSGAPLTHAPWSFGLSFFTSLQSDLHLRRFFILERMSPTTMLTFAILWLLASGLWVFFPLKACPFQEIWRQMRFGMQIDRPRVFFWAFDPGAFWVLSGCSWGPGIWGSLHFCASAMSSRRYGRFLVLTLSEPNTKCYFDSGTLMPVRSRVSGYSLSENDTKRFLFVP